MTSGKHTQNNLTRRKLSPFIGLLPKVLNLCGIFSNRKDIFNVVALNLKIICKSGFNPAYLGYDISF